MVRGRRGRSGATRFGEWWTGNGRWLWLFGWSSLGGWGGLLLFGWGCLGDWDGFGGWGWRWWIQVFAVFLDVRMHNVAPGVGAEGVDVFVLGELDGLQQGLAEIGEGCSGFGFDVSVGQGGENAAEGQTEIAGGEIFTGEEIGDVVADFLGGLGLGLFAGMEITEVRMAGRARSAAAAAIGEPESTQGRAVLGAKSGHRDSPEILNLGS
jgi:hypothetical protein